MKGTFTAFIRHYLGCGRARLILALLLNLMTGVMESAGILLIVPLLEVVDPARPAGMTGLSPWLAAFLRERTIFRSLPAILGLYLVVISGQALLHRCAALLNTRIEQEFTGYLRLRMYRHLLRAKWSFFLSRKRADLANIFASDSIRLGAGSSLLLKLAAITIVSSIQFCLAFAIAPTVAMLALGGGALLFLLTRPLHARVKQTGREIHGSIRRLFSEVAEFLGGLKEIKSRGAEERHTAELDRLNRSIQADFLRFARLQADTRAVYASGAGVILAAFLYVSLGVSHLPLQSLLVLVLVFARLWPRLSELQTSLQGITVLMPVFASWLQTEAECAALREEYPAAGENHQPGIRLRSQIEFVRVSFRYDRESPYALDSVDLAIPFGRITAVAGPSGAGKSTLADLLLGLLEPESGTIYIDGEPLVPELRRRWQRSVGYVPQEPFLFHRSIRENLLWAKPKASEEEIWTALRLAAADGFVRELPQGLDTVLGDRGIRLSGGERQRIVLARALLDEPSFLLLDEPTSALDQENESLILGALAGLRGKMTIVVIAHRPSTILAADRVIRLENGRVVAIDEQPDISRP